MLFDEWIEAKHELTVAFLGGSISNGAGASSPDRCYRSLVSRFLTDRYQKEIHFINACIGGTGSGLGLFRLAGEVLSQNPDLVFVEFAVNDYELLDTEVYMENIVRNILRHNAETKIVFLYTAHGKMLAAEYSKGLLPASVIQQERVAAHYGVPSVNMGAVLVQKVLNGEIAQKKAWVDDVHPTDEGHRIYADYLCEAIGGLKLDCHAASPCSAELYENPKIDFLKEDYNAEWIHSPVHSFQRLPDYVYSNRAGAALSYTFYGTIIGVYFTMEKDSGIFEYSIDNGAFEKFSTWDHYCLSFGRIGYKILNRKLKSGKHTLHIRISDEKPSLSEGTYVRIGAFLVDDTGSESGV